MPKPRDLQPLDDGMLFIGPPDPGPLMKAGVRPELATATAAVQDEMAARGMPMKPSPGKVLGKPTYGRRTQAQADELARRGTGSRTSLHLQGRAVDLRPAARSTYVKPPDGRLRLSKSGRKAFQLYGALAKKMGLEWGGDWKKTDMPHVQLQETKEMLQSAVANAKEGFEGAMEGMTLSRSAVAPIQKKEKP